MIFKTINDETTLSGQRIATSFTARKIAQEEAARQLEIDIQCLKNYEIECQKGTVSTETFATTMNGASVEAQRYASNIKNGTGSAQTFATNQKAIQASMNETSIASKAAAVGINIFKAALNTLIFFAVIEGIQLLVKGIDRLILTAEEAEEKAENLRNSMQSFFDEVQSGQQTISSISDRFSELSKHVTETGENIDLTKDEYSEYLDICNQVKSIMPELVTGYTNEGNAIITLKDNVDSLTESYKENIRAKAAAFVTNGDDDGNTIQSFFDDYKIFTEGEGGLFAPSAGGLWNNKSTDYEDYYGYDKIHEWLSEVADLSLKDLQNLQKGTTQATYLYALLKENGYELANITEDNYEAVHDVLDTRLTSLEGEMATRVSNVKMSLQQMLYADRDYWDIDNKEALSAIDSLFSSVDAEFIKQNNLLGQTALQSFESNVIRLFEDKNTQQAMIDIYAPQGTEESIEDYSKRVNNAIKNVQDYAKENKIDISLDFGDVTGDVENLQKQYDDAIIKTKDKFKYEPIDITPYQEALDDEYQKIQDWGLEYYANKIKNGTIQSVFGNVDMDKRTIITWSDELKQTYADALASWDYDPEVGSIDTVFGGSSRFGEELNGIGWEVAFTPILPDGTFLSQDTVYDYINTILEEAYADDGKVTEDELVKIDAQGRQIGNTFVQGIFAGIDDSQNYDNNGNWAETVGRLMHFSGDFGAVQIAKDAIEKAKKQEADFDWDSWFKENSINTQEEIDRWNEIAESATNAAEARKKYTEGEEGNETDNSLSSRFKSLWNSESFSDAKDKLLELAKSGEITPKTIESTTEYKKLINDTGLSAQEVTNNITSMLSVQEKLSAANQGLDKLKSSYEEFKDIGFVTAQTLESLPDAFKTLPDFNIFEKIVGNPESGKEKIQQAFNDITKSYLLEQNTLSGLVNAGDSEVQTYIANLKQMGITNAEEIVTQTRQALSQENQLINSAESEYENAHLNYINGKSKMDADYLTQTSSKNGQLASALGSTYKQDYDNWCNLLSQKAEAYNSFVKAIGSSYDASKGITDNVNAAMASGQSAFEVNKAASEYAAIKAKSNEMKNKIKLDLKQVKVNFKSNYSPSTGSSKSKGSGSSSKAKDTKQTIDWITRALTALEKRLDSTKAKFENLFSLKSKSSNLNTQLKQIKALESGYGKAANAYKKYANKVNLSSSLKKKVQSGSYSISDYSSATQEKIQQYQDYWDKYQDALSKQYEQKQAYREKQIEKYQLYVDDAESKISKYDTKIESTTSAKTEVSYLKEQNKLLSTSYDYQIKIAKAEGDSVKAETLSVEKTNKKNENLKAQYQAYLDEADAKLNKYESQYDNLTDTKSRVNNLKEQVKLIKSSYDYQIKIAQVDKDSVKVDQLKAEKQKEINENLKAQYQIYVDEADASKEMYDAQLSLESNYKEQNAILEKQKSDIIKSYDYQIKIAQVDKDIVKQKSLQAQKQKEINDLTKQEFDNISDTYSRILDYSNSQADVINAKISYIEEKGYVTSKNMYDQLISYVGENLETLDAELVILEKTLQDDLSSGKIKSGTDAWYEMVSAIQAVKKAQIEANTSLIEYEKNIRQLKWDAFNRAEDYISQIQDESNFLIDLMSNRKLYDDNGNWTEYANATAGLRAVNYNAYMAQADDYEKEIQNIQQQINNDPYNIDLIERKKELRDTQRDLIKSAKDEQEAIKSLVEDGYNKWLDALQKVIDKRKEELNQVSDLYEYEKKIAELTKDVSTYEKQKLALQGNDTEEAKAKIQKINVDLQNAKDNLEDTQYDQWKSDQESMLDSLSNEAQEFINQRLDNIDGLLSEIIESTNNSADSIRTTLESVTSEVGTSLSTEMTQALTPMGTIADIVAQYGDSNFANTSLGATLTAIKDYVARISDNSNNGNNDLTKQELSEIGKKEEEASKSDTSTKPEPVKPETTKPTTSNTTSTTKKPATTTSTTKKSTTTTASTKKATTTSTAKKTSTTNTSKKSSWGSWFIKKKFTGNKSKFNKDKSIVDRLKYKDFEAAFSARAKYYKAMGGTDKYTGSSKQNTWMIDQMKKHGFKSGGTIGSAINKSGEDGFVLARTGEEVLSLEKIKELGKSFQMINPVLNNLKTMIPDSQLVTRQNFGGNNIDKVQMEINLPNVTNYEEFKSELVKDKQFEKVVQSMTLGNALGKNSLSKYKIR